MGNFGACCNIGLALLTLVALALVMAAFFSNDWATATRNVGGIGPLYDIGVGLYLYERNPVGGTNGSVVTMKGMSQIDQDYYFGTDVSFVKSGQAAFYIIIACMVCTAVAIVMLFLICCKKAVRSKAAILTAVAGILMWVAVFVWLGTSKVTKVDQYALGWSFYIGIVAGAVLIGIAITLWQIWRVKRKEKAEGCC